MRLEASETGMPVVSVQLSTGTSGVFASELVRLLCLLLVLRTGLPRSMTEASDMFLLCEPMPEASDMFLLCEPITAASDIFLLCEPKTAVSDMFLLCEPKPCIGSRFSTLGEPRRSDTLEGDAALKGLEIAERGVGNGFGDRRMSNAL
jgi:hypothetical protein